MLSLRVRLLFWRRLGLPVPQRVRARGLCLLGPHEMYPLLLALPARSNLLLRALALWTLRYQLWKMRLICRVSSIRPSPLGLARMLHCVLTRLPARPP